MMLCNCTGIQNDVIIICNAKFRPIFNIRMRTEWGWGRGGTRGLNPDFALRVYTAQFQSIAVEVISYVLITTYVLSTCTNAMQISLRKSYLVERIKN